MVQNDLFLPDDIEEIDDEGTGKGLRDSLFGEAAEHYAAYRLMSWGIPVIWASSYEPFDFLVPHGGRYHWQGSRQNGRFSRPQGQLPQQPRGPLVTDVTDVPYIG